MTDKRKKKSTRRKAGGRKFLDAFRDEASAIAYLEKARWGDTVECPFCHSRRVYRKKGTIRFWRCSCCKCLFSACSRTVMERTHIPIRKWLLAISMINTRRDGVTGPSLADEIEIKVKSAWYLLHRIRYALRFGIVAKYGEWEIDEAYMVGKNWNRHTGCMLSPERLDAATLKIFGMVERHTRETRFFVVANTAEETLLEIIHSNIAYGSTIYSDGFQGYKQLWENYLHETVIHTRREFVRDKRVHTNTIESAWRTVKDDLREHMYVAHKYAQLYLFEAAFRFSFGRIRHTKEQCMLKLLENIFRDSHITCKELVAGELPMFFVEPDSSHQETSP